MAYAQWVTMTIKPNYNATLKNVAHSWGKFYDGNNKDNEIQPSAIEGHVIKAGDSYIIGACGRSDASSGTEGSFDIYDGDVKVGTLTWDCPWGSKTNSYQWTPNDDNYSTQVTGANLDSGALGNMVIVSKK
jgi:hypothetical protein